MGYRAHRRLAAASQGTRLWSHRLRSTLTTVRAVRWYITLQGKVTPSLGKWKVK